MIESNHYNTYSSAKYSNKNRTMYLAMNKRGQPRKVLIKNIPGEHILGKMATYTRVLTQPVTDDLEAEMLRALRQNTTVESSAAIDSTPHPLRHHGSHQSSLICPKISQEHKLQSSHGKNGGKFRSRKRKKRKKKRRKQTEGEGDTINSVPKHRKHCNSNSSNNKSNEDNPNVKSKDGSKDSPILSTDNNSNCSINSTSVQLGNHHHSSSSKESFKFTFNGITLYDCDQYKNINKHRKCEEARQRQWHKANFHLGEVDVKLKKRTNVKLINEKNHNVHKKRFEKNSERQRHLNGVIYKSTTPQIFDVFEDHTTEQELDNDDTILTTSTDTNDDGDDTTATFFNKVPRTPVPPPFNELDEFDDGDSANVDD